jgi:predicted DNA repair protein MutK
MIAMLWVGGGILIHGLNSFGFSAGEHLLHSVAETVQAAVSNMLGGVFAWIASATVSAIVGLLAGALTALVVNGIVWPAWTAIRGAA